jgi:hypothetical protein
MSTGWDDALDDYGRALLRFDEQLESQPAEVVLFDFRFPADLGPLPSQLLVVAASLAAMAEQTQERVRRWQDDLARDQAAIARARSHAVVGRPQPRLVDVQS